MRDDFAVGGRLKNGTFALQLIAQDGGVDQIAVVRDRDLAAETIDHERLRVFQGARAGRRIAGMPERARPFQSLQFLRAENLRDQAHVAMQLKGRSRAVARHDAGAFLPAMLEREEAVVGQHGGVRMAEDREDAALVLRKRVRFGRLDVPRRNQEASCPYNPSSERRFNHSFERESSTTVDDAASDSASLRRKRAFNGVIPVVVQLADGPAERFLASFDRKNLTADHAQLERRHAGFLRADRKTLAASPSAHRNHNARLGFVEEDCSRFAVRSVGDGAAPPTGRRYSRSPRREGRPD